MEQLLNPEQLAQLKSGSTRPVMTGDIQDLNRWIAVGKPHTWTIREVEGDYSLALDTGYGELALFEKDKLLGRGRRELIFPGVVVIDRDYYGTHKYIWL